MIDSIRGIVSELILGGVVLEAGFCSLAIETATDGFEIGAEVRLYLFVTINGEREMVPRLYGFSSRRQRGLFLLLRGVRGLGSATALRLVGSRPTGELIAAIAEGDESALQIKGVGPKTRSEILSSLKSKVRDL